MAKYSLLIADDDYLTVETICLMTDWDKLQISRVFRAYNGQTAIDIIENERPNIILCDIGMPFKSGMEVLRHIRERGIDTYFIFLTCHSSFEYAQEAIQLHAYSYLTKPFSSAQLTETIKHAVSNLEQEKRQSGSSGNYYDLFKGIYMGETPKDIGELAELVHKVDPSIPTDHAFYLITAMISVEDDADIRGSESTGYKFRHIAREEILKRTDGKYSFTQRADGWYRSILYADAAAFSESELVENCHRMMTRCAREIGMQPSVLIGLPTRLIEISNNRFQYEWMLQQMFLQPGKLVMAKHIACDLPADADSYDLDEIVALLHEDEPEPLLSYIDSRLSHALFTIADGTASMHRMHNRLMHGLLLTCETYRLNAVMVTDNPLVVEAEIRAEKSKENMLSFAKTLHSVLHNQLRHSLEDRTIVQQAIAYIKENFRNDIYRTDIAKAVNVSPNYLSTLFHDETGRTIREYLNDYRMKEIERQLTYSSASISSIALECGFNNLSYFSTLFRKQYGVSPQTWRKTTKEAD